MEELEITRHFPKALPKSTPKSTSESTPESTKKTGDRRCWLRTTSRGWWPESGPWQTKCWCGTIPRRQPGSRCRMTMSQDRTWDTSSESDPTIRTKKDQVAIRNDDHDGPDAGTQVATRYVTNHGNHPEWQTRRATSMRQSHHAQTETGQITVTSGVWRLDQQTGCIKPWVTGEWRQGGRVDRWELERSQNGLDTTADDDHGAFPRGFGSIPTELRERSGPETGEEHQRDLEIEYSRGVGHNP